MQTSYGHSLTPMLKNAKETMVIALLQCYRIKNHTLMQKQAMVIAVLQC